MMHNTDRPAIEQCSSREKRNREVQQPGYGSATNQRLPEVACFLSQGTFEHFILQLCTTPFCSLQSVIRDLCRQTYNNWQRDCCPEDHIGKE
jgi:hypothetical protein